MIPDFMLHTRRWSLFRKIWNPERKKFDKLVCTPNGGTPYPGYPNPENNRDFGTYTDVKKICVLDDTFAPAFYILKSDRLIFIDIDAPCEKPDFPTYTELSISGGYHIFGWYDGQKPVVQGLKEIYTERRWVIVTGNIVDGKQDINDITEIINKISIPPNNGGSSPSTQSPRFKVPKTVNDGTRNKTMFSIACFLRARGLCDKAIVAAIIEENQERCKPPLSDEEVRRIAMSACRYPSGDTIQGNCTADSQDAARERLRSMGLIV